VLSHSRVDPPVVFTSLAEIARDASTPKDLYAAICVAATLTVPGCDHASLMIRRDGVYSTAAVSDATARQIDKLELALGSGPCLTAIEECTAQIQTDLTTSSRWPSLASRVLAETPVRGALSVRMPVDRARAGALNLFSDKPNMFDERSVECALVLGAFATVATNAAEQGEDAASLRRGLANSRQSHRHADGAERRVGRRRLRHAAPDIAGDQRQACRRRGRHCATAQSSRRQ
jgi:transcriptional regulator with GAF, ATPase, and Fis domain